jgi:AcrR family transcriptional regulator
MPRAAAETLRPQPQDEKLVKLRRRQIFAAACRVLARKSFHEASVKELALEAGIAAGSIYLYLQSKDEIILLIAESMVAEFVEMLPAIRERNAGDPRRELIDVMRAILDVIDRYREAFNVLHHEARYLERRPEYGAALKKIGKDYLGAVAEIIERGKRGGAIHVDDSRSAVHAIHMLCAGWAMGTNNLKHTDKETYWREIAGIVEGRFFASGPSASGARVSGAAR